MQLEVDISGYSQCAYLGLDFKITLGYIHITAGTSVSSWEPAAVNVLYSMYSLKDVKADVTKLNRIILAGKTI